MGKYNQLIKILSEYYNKFLGTSCFITGSLARGEESKNSDIDIIIFIHDKSLLDIYRVYALKMAKSVAYRMGTDCSVTFTLLKQLELESAPNYMDDLFLNQGVWDDCSIYTNFAGKIRNKNKKDLRYLFQPVTYYYAKYLMFHKEVDLDKFYSYAHKMLQVCGENKKAMRDFMKNSEEYLLHKCYSLLNDKPLPSSQAFLAGYKNDNYTSLFLNVRRELFLENHGLEFRDAYITSKEK